MDLRQYDPAIGRWVVQDPVTHHDYSPYSAFDNNPVYWSDPSGADSQTYVTIADLFNKAKSGVTSFEFENGQLVGESFSKTIETTLEQAYLFLEEPTDDDGGGGDGNGGGKNKKANSRGVGRNYGQMGLLGMSGYTFFGAPIRLIPYDFGASSYFGGAINIYVGDWKEFLKTGLNSRMGRHLMHEYGHYLQEKYGGMLKYYGIVPYKSLGTINESSAVHASNWVELQANTLAYYYFGTPKDFISNTSKVDYFSINYNYIKIPSQVLFEIQNGYLQHPDYKQ